MRNFYKHQDLATSRSRRQVFWLTFAVIGTALVTSIVIVYLGLLACAGVKIETEQGIFDLSEHLRSMPIAVEAMLAASTLLVTICIGGKSFLKVKQLRSGGGAVVARDLGGTEIEESPQLDLKTRQLLNVVHEIAIAASIPPPPVYCMQHESAINAFAAGYTPSDAIICVTRGCLRELNREQLQGVIAHEFSHILNGDMRQNIRTIGALHGVLFVIEAAEASWRTAAAVWESDDTGMSLKVSIAMIIAAAFLWPVGIVGLFFATIAKAGISRQREYLADATAVELSRNPEGVANALKRIAGFDKGTRVRSPMAVEASHLFFANGLAFNTLLSTHPPITDRIRRLDPSWDGVPEYGEQTYEEYSGIYEGTMNFIAAPTTAEAYSRERASGDESQHSRSSHSDEHHPRSVFATADAREQQHRYAVVSTLPSGLIDITRDPIAAGATVIALRSVVSTATQTSEQLQAIVDALTEALGDLSLDQRLALLDKAVATLLSQPADASLTKELDRLATLSIDSLYEFAWSNTVSRVTENLLRKETPKPRFAKLQQAEAACSIVVSSLVHAGGNLGPAGDYAFRRGAVHLDLPAAHYRDPEECTIHDLQAATETLGLAAPPAKRLVCKTVSACITADSEVTDEEALIVRGVISRLGFPIPQLLPGHPITPGA